MTVRTIEPGDVAGYLRCMRTAFLGSTDVTEDQAAWATDRWDLSRTWSAFDERGAVCGTSRAFPTALTVPGGETIPMAAVTQVTVLPTQRRRGHLTAMMTALLGDARERGELAAGLIASEWPIYGRFGYGPATEWVTLRLDSRAARFLEPAHGSVELVDRAALRALAVEPFDRHRLATPGCVARDGPWWDLLTGVSPRPGEAPSATEQRAVFRGATERVDGYVVWEPKERWEDGLGIGHLEVKELVAATPEAYRELWRFLVDVDLTTSIHAWPRPVDEPLALHLHDGRALRWRERSDQLWLCLLDVPGALAARRYRAEGSLVLDVDGHRWQLDGGPDGASCTGTTATADLALPIASLGAAYLGGTSWRALAGAGLVQEQVPGAIERADLLFGTTAAPFLSTHF